MKQNIKKIYRNICLTEWNNKEIINLKEDNNQLKKQVESLDNKIDLIIKDLETLRRNTNEIIYSQIFHDTIKKSPWFDERLSLSSGAIGYPMAYILFRTLDDIKPQAILELGLGQSTKIITNYIKYQKNVIHDVVEHDENWIDFFKRSVDLSKIQKIHHLKNYKRKYNGTELNAYKNFKKEFENKSYDLIMIDGPVGWGQEYSRMDILDIIPGCLKENFVILLDDCERIGEQRTIEMLEEKLKQNNIKYKSGYHYWGINNVYICVAENLEFLCHI